MRKLITTAAASVLLLCFTQGEARGQDGSVSIANFAFQPATISIPVGATVVWTNNQGVPHTATSTSRDFDTGNIATAQTASFTFTRAGTFAYRCSIHSSMQGTVQVTEAAVSPPAPPAAAPPAVPLELPPAEPADAPPAEPTE